MAVHTITAGERSEMLHLQAHILRELRAGAASLGESGATIRSSLEDAAQLADALCGAEDRGDWA